MIDPLMLLAFVAAVIVLCATPGPDLLLIIGRGVSQGRSAAFLTTFGFFLAGLVQVPLLALGLSTLVTDNPVLFDILRYAGGCYLLWRGYKMIRYARSGEMSKVQGAATSAGSIIREGFVASLVNPKSHIFLLAFLPQFVRPEEGMVALQFIILGCTMRAVALLVEGLIGLFAGVIGGRLRRSSWLRPVLERIAGGLLLCMGLRLIMMERP